MTPGELYLNAECEGLRTLLTEYRLANAKLRAERDETTRTRNLAQEASTRDLEARRAAESECVRNKATCARNDGARQLAEVENAKLRADLAEALEALGDCQHECAVIFALVPTSNSGQAAQRCAIRAAAVLAKHKETRR